MQLLSVPRYADLLDPDVDEVDGDENGGKRSFLITNSAAWRREMAKWVQDEQDSDDSDSEVTVPQQRTHKWLPKLLASLFGGSTKRPVKHPARKQFTREALLMELLAAEEADEPLDDGALEGSGDDYDGT